MGPAVGIGISSIYLAVAVWVYFDALERDRAAIAWALVVLTLGWFFGLPLILYAILRDRDEHVPGPDAPRRLYLYVTSLTSLIMFAIGMVLMLTVTIVNAVDEGFGGYTELMTSDEYKEAIAGGIVVSLVGASVWLFHWVQAERALPNLLDPAFAPTFRMHRAYINTVLALFWISVAIAVLWLFAGAVSDALGVGSVESESWLPALAPLAVSLGIVGYHMAVHMRTPAYLSAAARFSASPQQSAEPAPTAEARTPRSSAEKRFCHSCGAGIRPTDAYCPACGATQT